jgi:hypothetical protein
MPMIKVQTIGMYKAEKYFFRNGIIFDGMAAKGGFGWENRKSP